MSKERIEVLKAEIAERELELKSLSSKMINEETDFHEKFRLWANNGLHKKCSSYIPDGDLRAWVDEHIDLGSRRGVMELFECEETFVLFSLSDEELDEYGAIADLNKLKEDQLFIKACEQMMKENIDSFKIDW
jgi:hypothetical protein